jgi:hypothetical protein
MTNKDSKDGRGCCSLRRSSFVIRRFAFALVASLASTGFAQPDEVHYFHHWDSPPSVIGKGQLLRGGPLNGYYQPVEILAPEGVEIAVAGLGKFQQPEPAPLKVGLLIGEVYRFKVTHIPFREGMEVYPSVEVVNRLYPPQGRKIRFPIPIELTQEELHMALAGQFVTRVIYLEDPMKAVPVQDAKEQRYFDVGVADDPLRVADELGRPMAILRMGSRLPDYDQINGRFTFGMPPLLKYASGSSTDPPTDETRPPAIEHHENVPRIPLPTGVFTTGQHHY